MSLAALTQPDIVEMVEAAALLSPISYLEHVSAPLVLRMVAMHLDQVELVIIVVLPSKIGFCHYDVLRYSFLADGSCFGVTSIEFQKVC